MSQQLDDLNRYVEEIRRFYPAVRLKHAKLLMTNGQFSNVVVVDDALIFRFPRSSQVADEMGREVAILKALQRKLPLPIPQPTYAAHDPDTEQLVFMGYPMLPGQPLMRDVFEGIHDETVVKQLAEALAGFLEALHSIPVEQITPDTKPEDPRTFWKSLYAEFRGELFPKMRVDARQMVTRTFEQALNDSSLWKFDAVLCHGDFGTGNILYSGGHITGIIDFTFCGSGDPAQDVGALLASYGEPFVEQVIDVYPALRSALSRTAFITSTYALQQALYALRDGQQEDYEEGIQDYV